MVASTSLSDLYSVFSRYTTKAFDAVKALSLWVSNDESDKPGLVHASGHDELSDLRQLSGEPAFDELLDGKGIRTIHVDDGLPEPFSHSSAFADVRSISVVPLRTGGKAIGLLLLCSRDAPLEFVGIERRLLEAFAVHGAIEIQRLRLIDHLREASRRLIEAQETERRAISQDIHDEIGGLLNSLKLMLAMTNADDPDVQRDVSEALGIVDEVIGHVRDISFRLSPRMLVDLGLIPTIQSYVIRYTFRTAVKVDVHCEVDSETRFRPGLESTAFRVVQESLTNVSKHAKARTASVHVQDQGASLVVHVIDDGIGFEPETVRNTSPGLGLRGLKERLELVAGDVEIASAPGEGTRVTARLPK